jgi:hypothetical protein
MDINIDPTVIIFGVSVFVGLRLLAIFTKKK